MKKLRNFVLSVFSLLTAASAEAQQKPVIDTTIKAPKFWAEKGRADVAGTNVTMIEYQRGQKPRNKDQDATLLRFYKKGKDGTNELAAQELLLENDSTEMAVTYSMDINYPSSFLTLAAGHADSEKDWVLYDIDLLSEKQWKNPALRKSIIAYMDMLAEMAADPALKDGIADVINKVEGDYGGQGKKLAKQQAAKQHVKDSVARVIPQISEETKKIRDWKLTAFRRTSKDSSYTAYYKLPERRASDTIIYSERRLIDNSKDNKVTAPTDQVLEIRFTWKNGDTTRTVSITQNDQDSSKRDITFAWRVNTSDVSVLDAANMSISAFKNDKDTKGGQRTVVRGAKDTEKFRRNLITTLVDKDIYDRPRDNVRKTFTEMGL